MSISIPGKIIAFDYGEVISIEPSTADRAEILRVAGAQDEPERFWNIYWLHRFALDQGTIGPKEYWRRIEHDLGAQWDTAQHHELWLRDFRSWLAIEEGTLAVLIDLQRGGTRMALLSNAGLDFTSYYRHGMLGDFFEEVVVSGELGLLKPEPAIYHELIERVGVPPADIVFIDNRAENIAGAAALGIAGHVYEGPGELRAFLTGLAESVKASSAVPPHVVL
ncbi:HAD-IA family hydrolase [Microbacterium jejuense]|uniref:HAD-IA family hydrolase n=1 Tax=Microbacterium jejuense TaxID=1263637 RepID=A0ABS7HK53_9MICO|nr:HAD-IA family hydrolase [Microbacterium jejuense]MBW9093073.1 HAD-IA family hydrolase [Microbacterium jejuense]